MNLVFKKESVFYHHALGTQAMWENCSFPKIVLMNR